VGALLCLLGVDRGHRGGVAQQRVEQGSERVRRTASTRLTVLAAIGLTVSFAAPVAAVDPAPEPGAPTSSSAKSSHSKEVHHDTSPALRDITPAPPLERFTKKKRDRGTIALDPTVYAADGVTQTDAGTATASSLATSFDGIGLGLGDYHPQWAPPDTAGAVGPEHFVEIVNTDLAIFRKDGTVAWGPFPSYTLWSGFPGSCGTRNDGDGTVEYDSIAGRWVVSQFATNGPPYYQCVAVSQTSDPLGAYNRYAFSYTDFPDYPKLGVWPNAYFTTFNMFRTGFSGAYACAYDRAKMLAGLTATQQCVNLGVAYPSLLPADLDGPALPPTGAPGYLMNIGTNSLRLWKFNVDWTTPANTRLVGPTMVSVAPFTAACNGGACIPQPETTEPLASLGDRLMYRLAYRNFGTHESLVVNHSIKTGLNGTGPTGIRWYEVRLPGGTPTVYQQGTYAPDSTYRWMGSAAMDEAGNLAVGYSASSSTIRPSLRWAGRLATDPLGTLAQGEGEIVTGLGSQFPGLNRWGDYTALSVDPVDDCTFWFVGQYLKGNGTWNWSTRIASFSLPGCVPPPPPEPDETSPTIVDVSPADLATGVARAANVTVTFDEPMDRPSAERAFSISPSIAGVFSWTANTMTFNPSADLTADTTYTASVMADEIDPATDTAGNPLIEGRSWSFTTTPITTWTAEPISVTREVGSARANGVGQLGSSDNLYYQVTSQKSGGTQATQWVGTFTGVSNDLTNLRVSYEGQNSRTATQTISIFRESTNSWVTLNTSTVGNTDLLIANLVPSGSLGDYVTGTSGSGDLRIRVRASRGSNNFFTSGDLLRIVYDAP
jgi:Bacterial Ig-like domain